MAALASKFASILRLDDNENEIQEEKTSENVANLLYHIILPRFAPSHTVYELNLHDAALVDWMSRTIGMSADWLPSRTIAMYESFKRAHPFRDEDDLICEELNKLRPGDTFVMFVRRQNTVFMCHMPIDGVNVNEIDETTPVIVATFPGQVNASDIYAKSMDLEVIYPAQALVVTYSKMLRSKEFAQQISLLCDELPIDQEGISTQRYLSNWLIAALTTDKTVTASTSLFPVVTKKIRDECTKVGDTAHWFRRSAIYMVMKAILQHNLALQSGTVIGYIQYKLLMLRFMTGICKSLAEMPFERLNIDLMSLFIAKMARRIEKIHDHFNDLIESGEDVCQFTDIVHRVIGETKKTISKVRIKIDKQIDVAQKYFVREAQLVPLKRLSFENDSLQSIPKLRKYLEERRLQATYMDSSNPLTVKIVKRHYDKNQAPKIADFDNCGAAFLCDFEWLVLYEMSISNSALNTANLKSYIEAYAEQTYWIYATNDKLGISRTILTLLKLLAILDHLVCQLYPQLLKHRPSINLEWFNKLLLPHRVDMNVAYEIEQYFRMRRSKAKLPGLIESEQITKNSFAVQFAAKNRLMMDFHQQILTIANARTKAKEREWQEKRNIVERDRFEYTQLECIYAYTIEGVRYHDVANCRRCALKRLINCAKVQQYEYPLPSDLSQQYAVVFELLKPLEIVHLRDSLHIFGKCGAIETTTMKITSDWGHHPFLAEFNQTNVPQTIRLGHETPIGMQWLHVDYEFETFVVNDARSCVYHADGSHFTAPLLLDRIHEICTLPVEPASPYSNLQWMINDTTHTQNEVLARQNECAATLSLNEFKNFGSLRADGCRLQWRQLFAMIETDALAFEQPSVLALCLQAIWEQNVSSSYELLRAANVDTQNAAFVMAMLNGLDAYLDRQRSNWMHPLKLILIASMATRLFELNTNGDVMQRIIPLLQKIREMAIEWRGKIEHAIRTAENPNDERNMRQQLVLTMIAGCITFSIHSLHQWFKDILRPEDTCIWLQMIVTLTNNNVLLIGDKQLAADTKSFNIDMWLQLVLRIGVNLETTVRDMTRNQQSFVEAFMRDECNLSEKESFERIGFGKMSQQTLIAEIKGSGGRSRATIDIVSGMFLMDGMPIARLPPEITSSQLYLRVFGSFSFEVQLDARGMFVTAQTYNDCTYEFKLLPNRLILIVERSAIGTEMELIPPEKFENEIPHRLSANYSHWWHKTNNYIEFRRSNFADKDFKSNIEYKLDMNQWRLEHMQTKRHLLDVSSKTFRQIADQLQRLECDKFVHIYIATTDDQKNARPKAQIELARMRLKFEVSGNGECSDLISNEFSGMKVSLNQNCGSLYGLRKGLILEAIGIKFDVDVAKPKILLMPHGNVNVRRLQNHVTVDIDVDAELRNPPFHQYQIDEFSRQIRSSNSSYSAWFYLAYLHAVTSHGEVEPLLGMSGTERALQILQSGFVWSSAPYDAEAWQILSEIAKLSPVRRLEDSKKSQIIEWPSTIPPRSAQESYVFIVRRLIEDSERLKDLYRDNANESMEFTTDFTLNARIYWRYHHVAPNSAISNAFIDEQLAKISKPSPSYSIHSLNMQRIIVLCHRKSFQIPKLGAVTEFLMNESTRSGLIEHESIGNLIIHKSYKDFVDMWIVLYDAARRQTFSPEQFSLIFSLLAHMDNPIDPILALQAVAMNPHKFININPPDVEYYSLYANDFEEKIIAMIIREHIQLGLKSHDASYDDEIIAKCTASVKKAWPCQRIRSLPIMYEHVCIASLVNAINQRLNVWYENLQLREFLRAFEMQLQRLTTGVRYVPTPRLELFYVPEESVVKNYTVDWMAKIRGNFSCYDSALNEAEKIWFYGDAFGPRSVCDWWSIYEKITQPMSASHLIDAGLSSRCVPSVVLPQITSSTTPREIKALIGVIALNTVHEQRRKRVALYESQIKQLADHEHEPHTNWRPSEYPEWLLFEIEQNVCIRPIQIDVAKRMIDPPDIGTKHSVMQLNMGEGKTSVIVPILAAHLANEKQVCQITVLKSLYATNAKALRQSLGGMLNRKLYHFPCRRDMPIEQYSEQLLQIYKDCKREKGVILTLPEYRCSFQLKLYETIPKGDQTVATNFLTIHKWLKANVQNILDESDAILHAKYQLIYTVGNQLPIDGGELRWFIAQAVMKRVPHHMHRMYQQENGAQKIEFDENYLRNGRIYGADRVNQRSDVFTPCRLLDQGMFEELKAALIEDFLEGRLNISFPEMIQRNKDDLRILLNDKQISKDMFTAMLQQLPKQQQNAFMILSGLLRFDVLRLILTKRWRVNYGVNVNGPRQMAVPFKAKDVAAEMTEFGHADVAICFTLISYYYSGLSNTQLHETFNLLDKLPNRNEVYEQWIDSVSEELRDSSIRSYAGINLCDPHQRDDLLFPLFRFNMNVIDFWLSQAVFPREAKTFEQKLMCTAWDLCSESFKYRVTGFSGTNDTKHILPLPVRQNDLKELEDTNDKVRAILLQPENQSYEPLPSNVSAMEILRTIRDKYISVLLDAGALMLELNNEQVARTWLAMTPVCWYDAAVYFDDRDVLQTIDRNGVRTEFDCSVYRDKLDRCLVYLDDTHTRGTDLQFPYNQRACVTLSGDITRDKTVQACMRMRKLGNGQSIAFYASYEADIRIRETCKLSRDDEITNEHVIEFISHNSEEFEVENMSYWALAASNYTKKMAGHRMHEDAEQLKQLYAKCVDSDSIKLKEMYGDKTEMSLSEIARNKFDKLKKSFTAAGCGDVLSKFIESMATSVIGKIKKQAPEVRRFIHALDEQQEKELEHETEQERHVQRPGKAKPMTPMLCPNVQKFLQTGNVNLLNGVEFERMTLALKNTSLYRKYLANVAGWSTHLFVTRDFVNVIEKAQNVDEYLRPVWWVAQTKIADRTILICLSSFECNRLMSVFEKSAISTLFMYRPRLSRFHSYLLHDDGLQVTGKSETEQIALRDIVQIGMFAGGMYFATEEEQNAYCGFMGLIPRPRTSDLNAAFCDGKIHANGYVDVANRQRPFIIDCVGGCEFTRSPVELAIGILEARNDTMNSECHAAMILRKGTKKRFSGAGDDYEASFNQSY